MEAPPIIKSTDKLMSLSRAAHAIKIDGNPISVASMCRWATKGKRGIVLPSISLGSHRATTQEALDWFWAAIQEAEKNQREKAPGLNAPSRPQPELEAACEEQGL